MKATSGHLKLDTTYKIIEYSYSNMENLTQCQNCGNIIANTATVKDSDGKRFTIGQDCAEGIIKVDGSDWWKAKEIKKQFNRKKSLMAKIKKNLKTGTVKKDENCIIFYDSEGIWSTKYYIKHVENTLKLFNFNINQIPREQNATI